MGRGGRDRHRLAHAATGEAVGMSTRKSRGAETQRVAAEWYRANGFPYCTDAGAGRSGRDLLNMIGLAPEVKARTDFSPLQWARQAARTAAGDVPFVLLRCNGQGPSTVAEWPVIVPNLHWTQMIRAAGFGEPLDGAS
jgi:hypothetical protein